MAAPVRLFVALFFTVSSFPAAAMERGLVEKPSASNQALLVGVANGLNGIGIDIKVLDKIVTHPAYGFRATKLEEEKGLSSEITRELTQLSQDARDDGTLLFYFSGHGNVGKLVVHESTMKIEAIRDAIAEGRKNTAPLQRLVMIFDSCYSGSLLDSVRASFPMTWQTQNWLSNSVFADSVLDALTPERGQTYWQNLFVFASSRADQTSMASPDGSIFTLAFQKAFGEAIQANVSLGDFVKKTQDYTKGHNPVARFVPTSLADEKMIPMQ